MSVLFAFAFILLLVSGMQLTWVDTEDKMDDKEKEKSKKE